MTYKLSRYYWTGISSSGHKIQGEMQAKNKFYVKIYLKDKQITPVKIGKVWRIFSEKLTDQDIILTCKQLSIMLKSGISLVHACHILSSTIQKYVIHHFILSLKNAIESGKNLSDFLKTQPNYFNSFMIQVIQLGEHTGKLDEALNRVAIYKENSSILKKHILQALLYPSIVFSISIIISLVMLICIVPRFAELFHAMHRPLPAFTQFVFSLSNGVCDYGWFFLIMISFLSAFLFFYIRSHPTKVKLQNLFLKLPFWGNLIQKFILARFSRHLLTSYSAGINLMDSLSLLIQQKTNPLNFEKLKQDIARGLPLHTAMQLNPYFSSLMIQMVKVGEEAGNLENMLLNVAILYEQDIEYFIYHLKQFMEPLIILILGVLIGGLIVAMYLPIFKLGTVI